MWSTSVFFNLKHPLDSILIAFCEFTNPVNYLLAGSKQNKKKDIWVSFGFTKLSRHMIRGKKLFFSVEIRLLFVEYLISNKTNWSINNWWTSLTDKCFIWAVSSAPIFRCVSKLHTKKNPVCWLSYIHRYLSYIYIEMRSYSFCFLSISL
jgi:hypothetical protein